MITDELLFRFIEGNTSARENQEVGLWVKTDPLHAEQLEKLRGFWAGDFSDSVADLAENDWTAIESRMAAEVSSSKPVYKLNVRYISIAATLLILIGTGLFFLMHAGMRTIRNKELVTQSFFLPDGTQVFLGPGSRLDYSRKLAEGERCVSLKGEAYFDVVADASHPFLVRTGTASIEVTGTQFSVNASRGSDEVEVSVISGKVLFYNSLIMSKNAFRMGLGPGEKGIYSQARNRRDKTRDPNYPTIP